MEDPKQPNFLMRLVERIDAWIPGSKERARKQEKALHESIAKHVSEVLSQNLPPEDVKAVGRFMMDNKEWAESVLKQELAKQVESHARS